MLLKQLEYFILVCDQKSFTEAANLAFISQSAISQQIKTLEQELGVTLLHRQGRSFTLTPAGNYFYRHGKAILKEVEQVKKETIRRGEEKELELRLGYLMNYGAIELHQAIVEFNELYPEVTLTVTTGSHEELYKMLINKEVDMLISDQRRAFDDQYVNYVLTYSRCFVELPKSHFLAQKEYIEQADLRHDTCILVASKEQRETEKDYYQNSLHFGSSYLFASSLDTARLMVASRRGYLPIDEVGTIASPPVDLVRVPLYLEGEQRRRKYCAFWKKSDSNYYIEEFAEMLRRRLKDYR